MIGHQMLYELEFTLHWLLAQSTLLHLHLFLSGLGLYVLNEVGVQVVRAMNIL